MPPTPLPWPAGSSPAETVQLTGCDHAAACWGGRAARGAWHRPQLACKQQAQLRARVLWEVLRGIPGVWEPSAASSGRHAGLAASDPLCDNVGAVGKQAHPVGQAAAVARHCSCCL